MLTSTMNTIIIGTTIAVTFVEELVTTEGGATELSIGLVDVCGVGVGGGITFSNTT